MKRVFIFIVSGILLLGAGVGYAVWGARQTDSVLSPITQVIERNLDKYTVDNLTHRQGNKSQIVWEAPIATESTYIVRPFWFMSDGKKVTGLGHVPVDASTATKKPVIIQLRGYVDRTIFAPGVGTKRSAEVFADRGFISLAPDFLGYGGSDNPSTDVFEERFQTYTVTLDLLASVGSLPEANADRVGIWAHSNGGQIALTALAITRGTYPTTLWAPVTRAFPYSILYYTDEAEDYGKALRKKLAEFERNYDADLYAFVHFTDRIAAPLQLHQGTADDAVPFRWNDEFVTDLKGKNITIGYYLYPGADHNLQPSWNTVIERDIAFFTKHLIER
jgi:dipeptidyl aminopeptidase/acylaminoacyl peptidase